MTTTTAPEPVPPQDIAAIFHASFHPTQGNVIDWSLKTSDEINLEGVEFSALPSGLHLVDRDVVYFTTPSTPTHNGVCIFRRQPTTTEGQRGFLLSSLGILLGRSAKPRPWVHISRLVEVVDEIDKLKEDAGEDRWQSARVFFEERKMRQETGIQETWAGWSLELDKTDFPSPPLSIDHTPTLHLPHLLHLLGPSSLTLYKHVLGRRRILIYTAPPVEGACVLCWVAADMVWEAQWQTRAGANASDATATGTMGLHLKSGSRGPIQALGMITLSDIDRLKTMNCHEGWVACTTEALFLEKPQYYDLLIDLTTVSSGKASRPAFWESKPVVQTTTQGGNGAGWSPTYRLGSVRFTWSDVRLWTELNRILNVSSQHLRHPSGSHPSSCSRCCNCGPLTAYSTNPYIAKSRLVAAWTDAWRVYEDVCLVCAGLWMGVGSFWRSTSPSPSSGIGDVQLEGNDEIQLTLPSTSGTSASKMYVRNLGMGIEGRPSITGSVGRSSVVNKAVKRSSGMLMDGGGRAGAPTEEADSQQGEGVVGEVQEEWEEGEDERRERHVRTTLALLQTLHANTAFMLSVLESFVLPLQPAEGSVATQQKAVTYLSAKDVLSFELGPFSAADARFLEWLWEEYAPRVPGGGPSKVVIKKSWREVLGIVVGWT